MLLFGDHGYHLGDHGLFAKKTNFEQATRVPLIAVPARDDVRFSERRRVSVAPVELLDVIPTMAALSTTEPEPSWMHAGWAGASLLPLMLQSSGEATPFAKEAAVSQWTRRSFEVRAAGGSRTGYAIRTVRYRLVIWLREGARRWQLVDGKTHQSCLHNKRHKALLGSAKSCSGVGGEEELSKPLAPDDLLRPVCIATLGGESELSNANARF